MTPEQAKEFATDLRNIGETYAIKLSGWALTVLQNTADSLDPPPRIITVTYEQPVPYQPALGDLYWILNAEDDPIHSTWTGDKFDLRRAARCKCFKTWEEALTARDARSAAVAKALREIN